MVAMQETYGIVKYKSFSHSFSFSFPSLELVNLEKNLVYNLLIVGEKIKAKGYPLSKRIRII